MSNKHKSATGRVERVMTKNIPAKPRFVYVIEWRELNVKAVIVHYDEQQACKMYSEMPPSHIDTIAVSIEPPGIILIGTL